MKRLVIVMLLISLVTFSGCGKKDKSEVTTNNNNDTKNVEENVDDKEYNINEEEINELDYALFLKISNEPYLISERFTIKSNDESLKNKTLEEVALFNLINFSEINDLKTPIPENTKLLSFQSVGKTCSIDLSKDFVENLEKDTFITELTIASIVNTVTVLDNYDKVLISIDGETLKDLNGVDMSQEFSFFNKFFFQK